MKFSRDVMPLKVTQKPYFLIPYLQPFKNGGRSNIWGGCKTCTSQHGIMKFSKTDRYSKDEQLLIRSFLSKNTNMVAVWMLKFVVCFVETTHEPLHLDKWTFIITWLYGVSYSESSALIWPHSDTELIPLSSKTQQFSLSLLLFSI
jgi:hypothetical protein